MAALDRNSLQELAEIRLEDARILLENQRFAASFYLAGYVIECALKACIARKTREFEFPDKKRVDKSYSHRLTQLLEVAQLAFDEDFKQDPKLNKNWSLISNKWEAEVRYSSVSEVEARDLLSAVNDQEHGVLQWLQKHW